MNANEYSGLSITYLAVSALAPNPRNSRTHSKRQIRKIAGSIREFGFTNPVLLDRNNTVIADHGRVAAAKLLGMSEVPTILLENLSPDQMRAYVIADNRLAEKAGWDKATLAIELQNLLTIDSDFDVTITGFEIPEIDILLATADGKSDPDDDFEIMEMPDAVTQPGDVWQLGRHRILCGNSTEQDSFSKLLGNKRAAVVFVDPPYNVQIQGNVSGNGSVRHREFQMASGEMSEFEFTAFLTASLRLLKRAAMWCWTHFSVRGPHSLRRNGQDASAMELNSTRLTLIRRSSAGNATRAITRCTRSAGKHLTMLPLKNAGGAVVKENDSKYTAGYGKPPKHTQFKPGRSGNPLGRPKKSTTFEDDVETELRSPITVLEGGERRRMTKRRAIAKQHVNRALKGDVRSTELLLNIRERQPSDQQDNLDSLLDEFREKNRHLSANGAKENDTSIHNDE